MRRRQWIQAALCAGLGTHAGRRVALPVSADVGSPAAGRSSQELLRDLTQHAEALGSELRRDSDVAVDLLKRLRRVALISQSAARSLPVTEATCGLPQVAIVQAVLDHVDNCRQPLSQHLGKASSLTTQMAARELMLSAISLRGLVCGIRTARERVRAS